MDYRQRQHPKEPELSSWLFHHWLHHRQTQSWVHLTNVHEITSISPLIIHQKITSGPLQFNRCPVSTRCTCQWISTFSLGVWPMFGWGLVQDRAAFLSAESQPVTRHRNPAPLMIKTFEWIAFWLFMFIRKNQNIRAHHIASMELCKQSLHWYLIDWLKWLYKVTSIGFKIGLQSAKTKLLLAIRSGQRRQYQLKVNIWRDLWAEHVVPTR